MSPTLRIKLYTLGRKNKIMKYTLSVIWLIFTILFFVLGLSHWRESKSTIPPFEVTQREMDKPSSPVRVSVQLKGTELDQPLKDFAKDFNMYLEKQNKSFRTSNCKAAFGYFLAALTALVSLLLEWRENLSKLITKRKEQKETENSDLV